MIIILKHIPAKTTKQQIKDFLMPELKGGLFSKNGQIVNLSLLTQRNIRTREVQNHGLVEVLPDSVGARIIKNLNGKVLQTKRVAVCEYKTRNWHNDPRIHKKKRKQPLDERRICDRREHYEEVVEEELSVMAKRAFHTKGW